MFSFGSWRLSKGRNLAPSSGGARCTINMIDSNAKLGLEIDDITNKLSPVGSFKK